MTIISKYPPGKVVASVRLAKKESVIDLVRIKSGGRTRFVESVWREDGQRIVMRTTDEFPGDSVADRFLDNWMHTKVDLEEYQVVERG